MVSALSPPPPPPPLRLLFTETGNRASDSVHDKVRSKLQFGALLLGNETRVLRDLSGASPLVNPYFMIIILMSVFMVLTALMALNRNLSPSQDVASRSWFSRSFSLLKALVHFNDFGDYGACRFSSGNNSVNDDNDGGDNFRSDDYHDYCDGHI